LFYNVHETLTVIVSNFYLFYVLFASLGLGLEGAGLGLGTAGFDYKTIFIVLQNLFGINAIVLIICRF